MQRYFRPIPAPAVPRYSRSMTTLQTLIEMYRDLCRINAESGNVAAMTLCGIQDDINRCADGLVWGS